MTWIVLVGAGWPASAFVAALLLCRMIHRADTQAADATAPNFVVDGPGAHASPGMIVPSV